ncbi:MAG TPA: B-box zinc finger protein [Actinomycetota bacterium]
MACPAHPDRDAVSACAVCGRAVCDLCVGSIDDVDFCPVHFEVEEQRVQARAYGLPPLPVPVTIPELLIGVWAVIGAFAPWMAWYRTIVVVEGPERLERIIDQTGWEAGGVAALASLSLMTAGLVLGFIVGVRIIRPRMISREPVPATAVALGATTLALLVIRVGTGYHNVYVGLYLAITSAVLLIALGSRLRRRNQ